jgi:hypothetical protein
LEESGLIFLISIPFWVNYSTKANSDSSKNKTLFPEEANLAVLPTL